ncbi:MAG: ZIP family metal transporter [Clostridia bacterium]|nr:ZIP family metal transporter [Clostridia bacterium]
MKSAIILLILITFLEGFSSALGGFLGSLIPKDSKKLTASLYEVAAGMMTSVVCFEMIPDSIEISNIWITLIGILIGVFFILFLDILIRKKEKKTKYSLSSSSFLIIIAMAAHNIAEGIAIGAGTSFSITLGVVIIFSIFLHNIPEGMIVGMSINRENKGLIKAIKYSAIVGMPTGLGAFFGKIVGDISNVYISISLAVASGAMLYIVACDLIPSSIKLTNSKKVYLSYILGILIGIIATTI